MFILEEKIIPYVAQNGNQGPRPDQRQKPDKYNGDLVNEKIRFPQVLVIGPTGQQLGTMSSRQALQLAYDNELDLLCVSKNSNPPVCKILDYGKYKFQQQKKAKDAKKKQHTIEVKEIKLTPQIGIHDIETKAKKAREFLQEGNKVKAGVYFRGRQLSHIEVGQEVLDKFIASLGDLCVQEKPAELEGKLLATILAPKKQNKK